MHFGFEVEHNCRMEARRYRHFISMVTQNIQPRQPWSAMGLKESELHN